MSNFPFFAILSLALLVLCIFLISFQSYFVRSWPALRLQE
jgi:hypothetical protein